MKYITNFSSPSVGEKFAKAGVNPFDTEVIYEIIEIRKDNLGNNWYKLDADHYTYILPESDLYKNFIKVEK